MRGTPAWRMEYFSLWLVVSLQFLLFSPTIKPAGSAIPRFHESRSRTSLNTSHRPAAIWFWWNVAIAIVGAFLAFFDRLQEKTVFLKINFNLIVDREMPRLYFRGYIFKKILIFRINRGVIESSLRTLLLIHFFSARCSMARRKRAFFFVFRFSKLILSRMWKIYISFENFSRFASRHSVFRVWRGGGGREIKTDDRKRRN